MPPPPDLVGAKFGRLLVLRKTNLRYHGKVCWECRCDCGTITTTTTGSLRKGQTRSCGCLHRDGLASRNRVHGLSHLPEYGIWESMKKRCNNPTNKAYKYYGGRGIRVCDRWSTSFEDFYSDMGPRPSNDHTLERIDSDGDYCPTNCRWATWEEQRRNIRSNRRVDLNGKSTILKDAADILGLSYNRLKYRLSRDYSFEDAVEHVRSKPSGKHGYNSARANPENRSELGKVYKRVKGLFDDINN